MLTKTIANEKRLLSVAQKVAIQINCKLGGEAWGAECKLTDIMVVGVDIYK